MTPPVCPVSGTWGRNPHDSGSYSWWRPPSVWIANLRNAGLTIADEGDYFDWSTAIDGIKADHATWETAGKSLFWWWLAHGAPEISAVGHSHAGQVIAYALAYSLERGHPIRVKHLITAGSPVRADIDPLWATARAGIAFDWTHVWTDETGPPSDQMQYLGSLPLDATFGFRRDMPRADRNVEIRPATSHHGLMWPGLWNAQGLWRYLQDGDRT